MKRTNRLLFLVFKKNPESQVLEQDVIEDTIWSHWTEAHAVVSE